MNEVEMLWDALWPGPGSNPYPLKKEGEMEQQWSKEHQEVYDLGVKHERERLIKYLMEKDILREALFYPGYVAFNTSGTEAFDLPLSLGAKDE